VVDEDNNPVAEIAAERGVPSYNEIRVLDKKGQKVASLGSQGGGGFLSIYNDQGKLIGYIDCETYGARMQLLDNHHDNGVILFGQEEGGGITITSTNMTIDIWTTTEGSEIGIWHNHPEKRVVSVFVGSTNGRVEIRQDDVITPVDLPVPSKR